MKYNIKELYNNYRNIQRHCLKEGIVIPTYLSPHNIPDEYKLSFPELKNAMRNEEKLREASIEKRRAEYLIVKGRNQKYSTLYEYWTDELETFLKNNKQFHIIIE